MAVMTVVINPINAKIWAVARPLRSFTSSLTVFSSVLTVAISIFRSVRSSRISLRSFWILTKKSSNLISTVGLGMGYTFLSICGMERGKCGASPFLLSRVIDYGLGAIRLLKVLPIFLAMFEGIG